MVLKFQLFRSITLNKAAEKYYCIILVCQIRYLELEHHRLSRRQRFLGVRVGDSNWLTGDFGGSQLQGTCESLVDWLRCMRTNSSRPGIMLMLDTTWPSSFCRGSCQQFLVGSVVQLFHLPARLSGGIQPKVRGFGLQRATTEKCGWILCIYQSNFHTFIPVNLFEIVEVNMHEQWGGGFSSFHGIWCCDLWHNQFSQLCRSMMPFCSKVV